MYKRQLELEGEDLFNQDNWYLWGLNRRQLLVAAASAGGVAGGGAGMVLDGATGGLTGGLGTLLSGIGGAWASVRGVRKHADDIAQWKFSGIPSGGSELAYGPSRNVNFPFVVLGRAMQHHRRVSQRTHAVRETLKLDAPALDWLDDRDRRQLARLFEDIREGRKSSQRRGELAADLRRWCIAVDQV